MKDKWRTVETAGMKCAKSGSKRLDAGLGLACGSLSLVMLLLTSVLHNQYHKPRPARDLSVMSFTEFALVKRPDAALRPQR
jgi:hypothetical protein